MISFGATDAHSNALDWGDIAATEGSDGMMAGAWIKENTAPSARPVMISDIQSPYQTNAGWLLEKVGSTGWGVRHSNASTDNVVEFTCDMSGGASHSIFWAWLQVSGSRYVRFYFDGVLIAQTAQATVRNTNAVDFTLGNRANKDNGYPGAIGHAMVWNDFEISSDEADLYAAVYHAHQSIPRPDKLSFWYKGTANPGIDEVSQAAPSVTGSVSLSSDAADAYYQSGVPQFLRLGSHRLHRRSTEEPRYQVEVPLDLINIEPMDLINISHSELPLPASRRARVGDDSLIRPSQRLIARALSKEMLYLERRIRFGSKDHESFGNTFWSSDRLPAGTNDELDGLGRMDVGSDKIVDRSSDVYLDQDNDIIENVAYLGLTGNFFGRVSVGVEPMNYLGYLSEDATTNVILNSAAKNSFTNWTQNANSGLLSNSTSLLAFPDNVTDRCWNMSRSDNANDTYITQQFAVLSAQSYRRIYVTFAGAQSGAWRLQRDTDSWYWNDASGAWQSGSVWNELPSNAVGSQLYAERKISKAVPVASDENWTIDVGVAATFLPSGGGSCNVFSISCLEGRLIFSEVPTDASAKTTLKNTVYHERTSLPQVFPAARGSLTAQLVAIQDEGDITDDDQHCLYYWQTDSNNYDAVLYERLSGETARVSFVRYISGSQDARAYCEVDIVAGTTYNLTIVWTDGTNNELDEGDYLMRVIVDQVVGVDAHASGTHSAAATSTQFWRGCAPAATGYRRAMNYLRNVKLWTRPLASEEAA